MGGNDSLRRAIEEAQKPGEAFVWRVGNEH
jgi:hypothetical protein